MDELISYLRDKTSLSRFSRGEIRDLIWRMEEDGWLIVRKPDLNDEPADVSKYRIGPDTAHVVEPEPVPEPESAAPEPVAPVEPEVVGPIIPHD